MGRFKRSWFLLAIVLINLSLLPTPIAGQKQSASDDDDFAEFDTFEEDSVETVKKPATADSPASKPAQQPQPQAPKASEDEDEDDLENGNIEVEEEGEEELPSKAKA